MLLLFSSMVADVVQFNSKFNMDSFLGNINTFLNTIPDHRPKGIPELLKPKCVVLNFPILFPPSNRQTEIEPDSSLCLKNVRRQFHPDEKSKVIETSCVTKDDAIFPSQCCYSDSNDSCVKNTSLNQSSDRKTETSNDFFVTQMSDKSVDSASVAVSNNKVKTEELVCSLADDKYHLQQNTEPDKSIEDNVDIGNSEPAQSELKCVKNSLEPVNTSHGDVNKPVFRTVSMKQTLDSWESSQPTKRGRLSSKDGPLHIVWPHRW